MEPRSCRYCGSTENIEPKRRRCVSCRRKYHNKLYKDRRALLNKLLKEMSMNELHGT